MSTVLASSAVCRPGAPAPGWVVLDAGTIVEVGTGDPPAGALDLGSMVLAPAFVDLQCNGVGDVDFADAEPAAWHRAAETLASRGTGSFCATFVSAPLDSYDDMLATAGRVRSTCRGDRAELLGVHLEGPFLGGAPGAHDPAMLRIVDTAWLDAVVRTRPGLVKIVTLAPEADPGHRGTRSLVAAGVVVALGHSTASYEDALAAADAGASVVTHLFNGMSALHQREPGLVGAALTDHRLTPTVIADLVHVHPAALRLAATCAPNLAAVSDAVAVRSGVTERDGAAWLDDGTLAGATALLDTSLVNLVSSGIPLTRAIEMTTSAPARILGLDDRGVLRVGARSDVIAIDPQSLAVVGVWLAGMPVAS